jgi:hypothetical protein
LSMGLNLGREKKIEVGVSERVFRDVWGARFLLSEICETFESSAVAWIFAGFWEWAEFCTGYPTFAHETRKKIQSGI